MLVHNVQYSALSLYWADRMVNGSSMTAIQILYFVRPFSLSLSLYLILCNILKMVFKKFPGIWHVILQTHTEKHFQEKH